MPPSIASRTERVERWRQPAGAARGDDWSESFTADYRLAEGASIEDAKAALSLVERLDARAVKRDYAKEAGRLKLLTKAAYLNADDMTAQIDILAEELGAYPLDAARAACRTWAAAQTFFPAWAELRELCEARVLFRRALASALRAYIELAETRARDIKALAKPETPANALWRKMAPAIKVRFGAETWNVWLKGLTPESDEDGVYTLATQSRFWAMHIKEQFGEALEEILDRRVVVRFQPWAGDAARERERKELRA